MKTYVCDPKKNTKCKKRSCQKECFCTLHKEYSVDTDEIINAVQNQVESATASVLESLRQCQEQRQDHSDT